MFGHVDNVFGKWKGLRSLQESRGEAARRALQWLDRLGMLPRSGLHCGLADAIPSSHNANHQSALGTAGAYHPQIPAIINNGLVSTNSSPHSFPWLSSTIGVPTLRQDVQSETSSGFEHTLHQNSQPSLGPGAASSVKAPHKQAQKPAKVLRKPNRRPHFTGGPTSSAANTIPLKRRRLPEKATSSSKEPVASILTKQGLLSRMNLYKEKVHRVAALCDYLSIAQPEYIMVDENQQGACFAVQFPATEVFLNRVGRIGLTDFIDGTAFLHGRVQGRELCASNVEAFLIEQVENGTFELQDDGEGDAHSTTSAVRAREGVTERVKRLRIDDNANRSLDATNGHIATNETTSRKSKAANNTDRPASAIAAGLTRFWETESLTVRSEPAEQHNQSSLVDCKENNPIMIKPEPIEQQLDLYNDEHKAAEPSETRWEPTFRSRNYDEVINGGAFDGPNAANMGEAAIVKAQMLEGQQGRSSHR